ncbi:MAG: carbohydrate kinase family protein [Oscillospiraceae bacterium]|nr:carbohydrate kinase family protein [Oscillospiraceae bacterium]
MINKKLALIGTCFTDIKGFAASAYDPVGRNLGSIEYVNGGVARNLAVNCAHIGQPVEFISMADIGLQGDRMLEELAGKGIGVSHVLRTEEKGTGLWLAILNEKGDLAGSISQAPDLTLLEKHLAQCCREALADCKGLMLDIDLNEAIADIAISEAEKLSIPVYGVVGNLSVLLSRPDLLKRLACFICNEIEAGKLFGYDLKDQSPEQVLPLLEKESASRRLPAMVITMGSKGSVFCDFSQKLSGIQTAYPAKVVDTTGAGDAFFSACVCALSLGLPLNKAVEYGAKLSAKVIESSENVCLPQTGFFDS